MKICKVLSIGFVLFSGLLIISSCSTSNNIARSARKNKRSYNYVSVLNNNNKSNRKIEDQSSSDLYDSQSYLEGDDSQIDGSASATLLYNSDKTTKTNKE